jgi:predicted RecB family nuclease
MLVDLAKNTVTKFDKSKGAVQENELQPEADSLSMTVLPLVFRQKQQTFYLNMQPEHQKNWLLYAVTVEEKGKMTVKVSFLKDKTGFEKRLDAFNKITPFQKTESDYLINPTDEALDRLLGDPELFETGYLVKISEG